MGLRGLSHAATVVLIVLMVFVAGFFSGFLLRGLFLEWGEAGAVRVVDVSLLKLPDGRAVLTVDLKNIGSKPVVRVVVHVADEEPYTALEISNSTPLQPGESRTVKLENGYRLGLTRNYVAGEKYTVSVEAVFHDGSTFSETFKVTCEGESRRWFQVPASYYEFVMNYSPYIYVYPNGTPDYSWGRSAFAASFSIEFLYEAYHDPQFRLVKDEIYGKIVELADWLLTQQCLDEGKLAYGGFKSTETSIYYYSIDAGRAIPALLKAYNLTGNATYLEAAKKAGVFLYNMQHKPYELNLTDRYYGGFARAVVGDWFGWLDMDVECLYNLYGLKMLAECDPANRTVYEEMMRDAAEFLRKGLEGYFMHYNPSDDSWHRAGTCILDDCYSYALYGLYKYEGCSGTGKTVYEQINSVGPSPEYPEYNASICWAGYIDVVDWKPACHYYDVVTSGILWEIRKNHDPGSLLISLSVIDEDPETWMVWGVTYDFKPLPNLPYAMATVCWIALLYLNW